MPFSQSPIEASIWTAFVSAQQFIAESITSAGVFQAAIATWLAFLLMRAFYEMVSSGAPGRGLTRFLIALGYSALGLTLLRTTGSADFRPVDARGAAWADSARVRSTGKHDALSDSTQGLAFYVAIHKGVAAVGSYISSGVARIFRDGSHEKSPYLLLQTMAQTSSATIDDPKVVSGLEWLSDNCGDQRQAAVLSATASFSALFDLASAPCKDRYDTLRRDLSEWARDKWGSSTWNIGEIKVAEAARTLGIIDETALQNKMIASALVNAARSRMGQSPEGVHTEAMLGNPNTSFFVAVDNMLSTAGMANGVFRKLTGIDFAAADQRNQSAVFYNRIMQFIPPIRGYAKGLIAIAFVFAAGGMCFGTPRFMISWFGMLIVFTAYEPLSTLLYETTMALGRAPDTTEVMAALRDDPLVLGGAAIVDDNMARIQAVYFSAQLGLALICGGGGISIFMFSKRLGAGLSDNLVAKIRSTVNMARSASR